MQQPRKSKAPPNRTRDPLRDALVVVCMTVVALALGIGLHLQFALPFWLSVLAAISVYVALLSAHVLLRRSQQIDDLRDELSRLEVRLSKPQTTTDSVVHPFPMPSTTQAPSLALAHQPSHPANAAPQAAIDHGLSMAATAAADYWQFSPVNKQPEQSPHLASLKNDLSPQWAVPASQQAYKVSIGDHATEAEMPPSHRDVETDAEHINAVIKKIAADITQGQAAIAQSAAAREPQSADLDSSIAALQAVADAMRDSGFSVDSRPSSLAPRATIVAQPPGLGVPASAVPMLEKTDPARERLAAVAESIERERFDVMLEPILGLGDRRAQHYIVTLQMRSDADQAATDNEALTARGSGLLPLLDAVKVERAARVAWRMEDRGKAGSLFSQLSGESLVSDRFLNRFADTYRQGDTLGSRLVLTFRQAEVRTFSELQWATVRDMADLGFRFCIEMITDLDFDFEALATAGFTFAKLDAGVFLDGLVATGGMVTAADICRHFTSHNLAVIVGGISDEAVSTTLQSYGVELGQGRLFGEPRAVKSDVLRNPHAAVA